MQVKVVFRPIPMFIEGEVISFTHELPINHEYIHAGLGSNINEAGPEFGFYYLVSEEIENDTGLVNYEAIPTGVKLDLEKTYTYFTSKGGHHIFQVMAPEEMINEQESQQ